MEPMVRPARPASWNCLMNRQGTVWNRPEPEPFTTGSKWNRNRVEPEPERNRPNPDRGHAYQYVVRHFLTIRVIYPSTHKFKQDSMLCILHCYKSTLI